MPGSAVGAKRAPTGTQPLPWNSNASSSTEKQWPIFREMAKEGAYPSTVIECARKMHSDSWCGKPLLGAVFGHDGLCGPHNPWLGDSPRGGKMSEANRDSCADDRG